MRIGVVGASMAGCAAALALTEAGHEVTVYERSPEQLEERGGGVGLPTALVERLKATGHMDADLHGIRPSFRDWCVADGVSPAGRRLNRMPGAVEAQHWGLLHAQFQKRATAAELLRGETVIEVIDGPDRAGVRTGTGDVTWFDIVVAADGYRSETRRALFPEAEMVYAGYPAWRGTVEESDLADVGPALDSMHTPLTARGHAVFYLIPGAGGEVAPGRRRLNWLWYDASAPEEVLDAFRDASGRPHVRAVSPGEMSAAQREHLVNSARAQMPPWHHQVIAQTELPYLQPIYSVRPERLAGQRVCLIGDAACLASPHTGSGSTKAIEDAFALARALTEVGGPVEALRRYDAERTVAGNALVDLGRTLGREQVTEAPDWAGFDEAGFERWVEGSALGQTYMYRRGPAPASAR